MKMIGSVIESVADGSMDDGRLVIPVHNVEEKDKFRLFVQHRGKCTEQYARALHNIQAPCMVIMTLRGLKTVFPALKLPVVLLMRCDVIYQIMCPRCQVLLTSDHMLQRAKPIALHFAD